MGRFLKRQLRSIVKRGKRPFRHIVGAVLGGAAGVTSGPVVDALSNGGDDPIEMIALAVALAVYALVEKQLKRLTGEVEHDAGDA